MSLSRVHSSADAFEPEDLISGRFDEEAVFGSIIVERLPAEDDTRHAPYQEQEEPQREKNDPFPPPVSEEPLVEPEPEELFPSEQEVAPSPVTTTPAPAQPKTETVTEEHGQQPPQHAQPPAEQEPIPESTQSAPTQTGIPTEEVQQMLAESYENGLKDGLAQAENDLGATAQSLVQICQQLDTIRETILRNSVGEMQALVLSIAEKIIRKSVEEQSQTVLYTVEEAIQKAVKSDELFIYVHPDDYAVIEEKLPELMQGLSGLSNLAVKKDPSVERGGCRVESDNCTVDATTLSQLEIITEQVNRQK